MPEASDVAAVIVTYNRKMLLCEVIDAILKQDCGAPHILIVDNHSTDGTKEAIGSYLSSGTVFYEDTGENLGGAGGFHFGVKKAVGMGYERLWIMDDDCVPEKSALSALLDADNRLKGCFGWLSSIAYWTDGTICKMNVQRHSYTRKIKQFNSELMPAQFASFVSLYATADVVRDMGLIIPEFVIWVDDWEWTRRISKKYLCYVASGSRVCHKMSQNMGTNIAVENPDRLWRYRYGYRNEVYIMRREGPAGWMYFFLKTMYHTAQVLLRSKGERMKKLHVIYKGIWDGFHFYPKIEFM